eukprot:364449-Chlamydomonas_euryale.AAC.6
MAQNIPRQPITMHADTPQKPSTLDSSMLRMFMPKMPATMAPSAAAKLPIESVSSRRLTCGAREQGVESAALVGPARGDWGSGVWAFDLRDL